MQKKYKVGDIVTIRDGQFTERHDNPSGNIEVEITQIIIDWKLFTGKTKYNNREYYYGFDEIVEEEKDHKPIIVAFDASPSYLHATDAVKEIRELLKTHDKVRVFVFAEECMEVTNFVNDFLDMVENLKDSELYSIFMQIFGWTTRKKCLSYIMHEASWGFQTSSTYELRLYSDCEFNEPI